MVTKVLFCCIFEIILLGFVLPSRIGEPIVLVHGGAGNIADESVLLVKAGVKCASKIGYETLQRTGSVMDAVQEAVRSMELNPIFNAGFGSVLTLDGTVEMDAAIMNGADLSAGCVSIARDIYHPISLARAVMEHSPHRYLAGEGLMKFAKEIGFDILPEGSLVTGRAVQQFEEFKKSINLDDDSIPETPSMTFKSSSKPSLVSPGTVGAVAIDSFGNVAAATSTGGITGKMPGRIGDSPILGGGTYADNDSGSVSCTGHGETFMRYNVASRILSLIQFGGLSAQEASAVVLNNMTSRFNQTGGVITIDHLGGVGIYFTSKRMAWSFQLNNATHFGVDQNEHEVEYKSDGTHVDFY